MSYLRAILFLLLVLAPAHLLSTICPALLSTWWAIVALWTAILVEEGYLWALALLCVTLWKVTFVDTGTLLTGCVPCVLALGVSVLLVRILWARRPHRSRTQRPAPDTADPFSYATSL